MSVLVLEISSELNFTRNRLISDARPSSKSRVLLLLRAIKWLEQWILLSAPNTVQCDKERI